MKTCIRMVLAGLMAMAGLTAEAAMPVVTDLELAGKIEGENIVFSLKCGLKEVEKGTTFGLVSGDVAYTEGKLPGGSELIREGDKYVLVFKRGSFWGLSSSSKVDFQFASRPVKNGEWRETSFVIPAASVRKISVECDRDDLEIKFPGALELEKSKSKQGKLVVTAFLGTGTKFEVNWKPQLKKFDSELVVACDANTIASAGVGALRLDSMLTYRIIQGEISKLTLALPDINITQVRGEDIQDWKVDKSNKDKPVLVVTLSRPKENIYRLAIEGEMVLPKFPSQFTLPVLVPQGMLRTSGFLLLGSDSATKLSVLKAGGLTQVDIASFPSVEMDGKDKRGRPTRSSYSYQYSGMPYTLEVNADDIVTSYSVEDILILGLKENELAMDASVELDIKDAPARDILIEIDPDPTWTVTAVSGQYVAETDTDIREEKGKRFLYVPFKSAVSGAVLLKVRMERVLAANQKTFQAPLFRVTEAKSERGYLVICGEKGLRLKVEKADGLRDVHNVSLPVQVPDIQQSFRFRSADWKLALILDRTTPAIHCETFQLTSLGEGLLYSSASLTYHISAAPVNEFKVRIPTNVETYEITGLDIESWSRTNDICTVRLNTRISGDYTLLVTWDRQYDYYRGEPLTIGNVETVGADSEVGYVVVASAASVKAEAGKLPESTFEIAREEVPARYAAWVGDPIISAFKYVKAPHSVNVGVKAFAREELLGQVADFVTLDTEFTRDGESVTTASYYIKNASRQHFILQIPKGTDLWSVKYTDENGKEVTVRPQESKEGLLVPVERLRDPNTPLKVTAVYARKHGGLGFLRSGVFGTQLVTPVLPMTHSAFASWRVKLPAGYVVCAQGGNMTPAVNVYKQGVYKAVLQKAYRVLKAVFSPRYTLKRAMAGGWGGDNVTEYTGAVVLARDGKADPLCLSLSIVPAWIGAYGSARMLLLYVILAIAVAYLGRRRKWGASGAALAITLLTLGLIYTSLGRFLVGSVLAAAILIGLIVLAVMLLRRISWRKIGRAAGGVMGKLIHRRKAMDNDLPPFESIEETKRGSVDLRLSGMISLLAIGLAFASVASAAAVKGKTQQITYPAMNMVTHDIECPISSKEAEKSARVKTLLEFEVDAPVEIPLLPSDIVLTEHNADGKKLELAGSGNCYVLRIKEKGKYKLSFTCRVPVTEIQGRQAVSIPMPVNLRNKVHINVPEAGMDIQSDTAVLFRTTEKAKNTEADAVYGPVSTAVITWRPRVRKTKLEDVMLATEISTYALLQAGVVDLTHSIRCQIVQGELRELKLVIPEAMTVTSVAAAGVATWSFDPDKRMLDIVLEQAVTGDYQVKIVTQIASGGLPYEAVIRGLRVLAADRQRGMLAIAAPENVQVKIDDVKGLNPMNIEDFGAVPKDGAAKGVPAVVRKAFRYHQVEEVSARVSADKVLSELRVVEDSHLDISDERMMLREKIDLEILKAGIFSVDLELPPEFEVESVTGAAVSHWDETKDKERSVTVHFNRQTAGQTSLNLVIGRSGKGIDEKIVVPRIQVTGALRHTGRFTVTGERGVRWMVDSQKGIDIKKASEEGIRQAGVLVFDILRPSWELVLKTEVMSPVIKPDVLQLVNLTEGMLHCKALVHCQVENAGVKMFQIKSPQPKATLTVTGRNVARFHEVDAEKGIWQVELQNKAESAVDLTIAYQLPYNTTDRSVKLRPLQVLGGENQRGYLVVSCEGRIQVKPEGVPVGLKQDDPRSIPSYYGAEDLSASILCYKAIDPQYELSLSVVRHETASVLPATVQKVRLMSLLSQSGKLLTRADIQLEVGTLRFLRLTLPGKNDELWTVRVNSKEVLTSRENNAYLIPLESREGGNETQVSVVYAGSPSSGGWIRRSTYEAPSIGLPLKDITWDFYLPTGLEYGRFGGNMERVGAHGWSPVLFDMTRYNELNRVQQARSLKAAKTGLDESEVYKRAGQQKKAREVLQQAMTFSQADPELHEDARVQLRNWNKQQIKMGLINSRDAVRLSNNIVDDQQMAQMQGFREGDFTQDYAARVERGLSEKDNIALDLVAEKMMEQQASAASVVSTIDVTIPEHGVRERFHRESHIKPGESLTVKFTRIAGFGSSLANVFLPSMMLFGLLWIFLAARRNRKAAA